MSSGSIRASLDAAAGTEIAFVLFRENSYLEQNRRLMDQVRRTTLDDLSHLGGPETGFDRIPAMVGQYEVTMTQVADLYAGPSKSTQPLGDFEKALARLQVRLRSLRDRAAADSVLEEMLESAREENPDRTRLLDETSRIRGRIDAVAEQIQERALSHMETHRRHVVSLSNRAERNILTTIVLTGMVGIYLVLFLPSRVVRSLRRITHVLQQAERYDELAFVRRCAVTAPAKALPRHQREVEISVVPALYLCVVGKNVDAIGQAFEALQYIELRRVARSHGERVDGELFAGIVPRRDAPGLVGRAVRSRCAEQEEARAPLLDPSALIPRIAGERYCRRVACGCRCQWRVVAGAQPGVGAVSARDTVVGRASVVRVAPLDHIRIVVEDCADGL